jgi:hypothetical protein
MADRPRAPIFVKYWPRFSPFAQNFSSPYALTQVVEAVLLPPQYDYPLPPKIEGLELQLQGSLNLNLIAEPVAPQSQPFKPRPLIFAFSSDISWLTNNPSIALLTSAVAPAVILPPQYDYPLPPPLRQIFYAQNYPSPYALITIVAVNPFSQSDWSVPIQPPRVYAAARSAFPPLLHSVYPPINLEIWPPPTQPYRVYAQSYATNFQLLSSIKPPNREDDWPQIISPPRVYAQSYAPSKALTFVQPVPFVQSNWPNPIQPYRVYAEARSAFMELLRSVKPFVQSDWPRPKLIFGGLTWTQAPSAPQLQQPFNQEDWPVPVQPYRVYAIVRRADIALLHSIQPPNEQSDWPVPIQPGRVYAKSHAIPATLLTPETPPIRLRDWPAPTSPPRVYAETRRADVRLLHSVKPPNAQVDWPLPKLVRRLGETIAQPPHPAMLAKPFNQPDWPNPKLVLLPTSAQGWINRVNLALQIAPRPNNQFDWPIPKPSRPPNDRRTYVQAAPILLGIPEQPKPVKQDAWPVPVQPVFPFWTRQFGQGAWPTIGLVAPPLPRVPTESRFRSPLQDDDTRPDVPDQRRPGVSAIRRPTNESPSSARDKSWRYE